MANLLEMELLTLAKKLAETVCQEAMEEAKHLIDHGEYGVAFEGICAYLKNEKLSVSRQVYRDIVRIGTIMNISSDEWEGICRSEK